MRLIPLLLCVAALGACTTTGARDPSDPYEGFNRGMFAVNDAVDKAAIKPVSTAYRTVTPVPARRGISRVLSNLGEPFSFVNNLLQGKPKRALNNLGRFFINTTIGVGGLADHATDLGLPDTSEDFGQTLAAWGAKDSPYLVLPLLGPSTVRDGVGTVVRFVADPATIALNTELSGTESAILTGTRVIDGRAQATEAGVDRILETSADPYATARSAYLQRRRTQLADEGAGPPTEENADTLLERALEEEQAAPNSQPKQ